MDAVDPFSPAVSVTLSVVVVAAAEAVNVAELCPPIATTLGGAVTLALLLDSETTVPPVGAAPLRITVQLVVPGPVSVAGAQLRELTVRTVGTVTGSVIVPADVAVGIEFPTGSDVETLESESTKVVAVAASCKFTEAKFPSETTLSFIPKTTHVADPDPFLQLSDLLATVAAAPTVTLLDVTLAAGKVSVH